MLIVLFYLLYNNYNKNIGKEEKKKWWGDLIEIIGVYERLGFFELWVRVVLY